MEHDQNKSIIDTMASIIIILFNSVYRHER